jgi:hypothetical protein
VRVAYVLEMSFERVPFGGIGDPHVFHRP